MTSQTEWLDAGCWIGRHQAFALITNKCSAAQAQCIAQIKEANVHTELGLSWDDFCTEKLGLTRPTADRIVDRYNEFGDAYFKLSALARISPEAYREIAPAVTSETIAIDGDHVALTDANASRIRGHIANLRNQLRSDQPEPAALPPLNLGELSQRLAALVEAISAFTSVPLTPDRLQGLRQIAGRAACEFRRMVKELDHLPDD